MAQLTDKPGKGILLFLFATFLFTWAFWVPMAFMGQGWDAPGWVVWLMESKFNVAAFGPLVGAIVVMLVRGGLGRAGKFLWQGLTQPFRLWLLLPALLLFPLITGVAVAVGQGPDAVFRPNPNFDGSLAALLVFVTITLDGGPLQEEFGWRGFLLPALQQRMSGLGAALVVGIIWALWHFPLNFENAGRAPQYSEVLSILIGSIITITLISILIAWVYNASGGSVLLTILMHGSLNFSTFVLFPVFEHQNSLAVYTGLILLTAILLVVFSGPRRLGRPRF